MQEFDDEIKKAVHRVAKLDSLSLGSSELNLDWDHDITYCALTDYLIDDFVSKGVPVRLVCTIVSKTLSLAAAAWLMPAPSGE